VCDFADVVMGQMRLFVAVNLPDSLKKTLADLQRELKGIPADAKWVGARNLHLTVQFLGDVSGEQVPEIVFALQEAARGISPFTLDIARTGVFPGTERARVFWAGVGGELPVFSLLHRRVQGTLAPLGFIPEKRPFSPHLTLARLRSPRGADLLLEKARVLPGAGKFGTFRVESVDLMQSELDRSGAKYSCLAGVNLFP
jgi:2'-5' RNA ligase